MASDVFLRGGTVVFTTGSTEADIRISGETIVDIGPELSGVGEEIDARGLHVMPGIVDVHVHFNEPGRSDWEGALTGSEALAAGGGTMFIDMPLNSSPCTLHAGEVERKRSALEQSSIADFGIWGGLVPGNVGELAGMAERGVVGFKAFMCDSGLAEFPRADDDTLFEGMKEAARLNLPVAVHAESQAIVQAQASDRTGGDARAYLQSRPLTAELEAIVLALDLAAQTGARLHIVHVSSGSGVARAAEARRRGVDVSVETCPHYLFFTEEDVERIGVAAKCAPPFRSEDEQRHLWTETLNGGIDIVASDHSPAPPAMKIEANFRASWGGIAGVQSTLSVLLSDAGGRPMLPLERIAHLTAVAPAARFGLASKGAIAPGNDADLLLLDASRSYTLDAGELRQRHKTSPYVGRRFRGSVVRTLRRGETIFADGRITARRRGRFVRPRHAHPF